MPLRMVVLLASTILVRVAAPQDAPVPADTLISLRRTSCLGTCPVYTVTIDAGGTVTFTGEKFVRVVGRRTARIGRAAVARLLARAEGIGFFDLKEEYRYIRHPDGTSTIVTDLPTKLVTVTARGRTKRVANYLGGPEGLGAFEREIDEAAGTKRWIFVDEASLDSLLRSGWTPTSDEGAQLLRGAIERDDLPIARALIEAGAALGGPPAQVPPLLMARSAAMVRLLVQVGADPNDRPIGAVAARTPLMSTAHKDAAVAEALLNAGAVVDATDDGRTALFYAACAGNWRVVNVLLSAGADPLGSKDVSAAECTRQARQAEASYSRRTALDRGRPTVEDFDRVLALLGDAEKRMKR